MVPTRPPGTEAAGDTPVRLAAVVDPTADPTGDVATEPVTDPTASNPIGPAARELFGSADLGRTLDRIAHQILERNGDADVVLLGIPTRGVVLARRLAGRLQTFTGIDFPVGSLDITLYRDDLRRKQPRALAETRLPPGGVDDRIVVLVDDVLFSGRSVRAALDALRDHGRPSAVQLAVVVDRGHRQLPLRADYVGKNVPTALADSIAVRLIEVDGWDGVELRRAP